jgi:hypothetical protein
VNISVLKSIIDLKYFDQKIYVFLEKQKSFEKQKKDEKKVILSIKKHVLCEKSVTQYCS